MTLHRRRPDDINGELREIDHHLERQDKRLDKLESRVNQLFAGLAILVTLINFLAPVIVPAVSKSIGITH